MKVIATESAPKAVGPYSQGIEYNNTIFYSGQIGINPATAKLEVGFESQLKQILINIDALLSARSLKREHIIKTTIFVTDLSKFSLVNQAYEQFFKAPYPARSTVQVSALPLGSEIEIEVIARTV
ncbi:MAG: Rid family detoxifying hydrolase [Bacteriovoracaceae bacterium]